MWAARAACKGEFMKIILKTKFETDLILRDIENRSELKLGVRTILELFLTSYLLQKGLLPGQSWKSIFNSLDEYYEYQVNTVDPGHTGWIRKELETFFLECNYVDVIKVRTIKSFLDNFEKNSEEIINEFCLRHKNVGTDEIEAL